MSDRERALRVVGTGLAKVGDVTRRRWGNLLLGRRRGYFADFRRDVVKQLRRLRAAEWKPATEIAPRLGEWLEGYRSPISSIRTFGLGHRAVIGSNLLVTEDDELCLIDFQRLRYEAYPSMLVRALFCVCRDEAERQRMLEHYFSATSIRNREDFDRLSPPFEALWLLKLIRSGVNDERLGRVADVAPEWVDRLRELLEVQPVG
jgi:hypothetical protein